MRLLVLGGTNFLGRHLADDALRAGHEVTLFHRGVTNPHLFPEAEHLLGDRNGDHSELRGREWDAVIDCSAYLKRHATASGDALAGAVERYVFVSTISVYDEFTAGMDESAAVARLPAGVDDGTEDVGQYYGALKAVCEDVLRERLRDRLTVARPGLIVGPFDPTERFTYWPRRAAAGGEIVGPGAPDRPVQFIDARDLAAWLLVLATARDGGVFNATGPAATLTFGEMLDTCVEVGRAEASVTWVPDQFLLDHEVAPWVGLPLWLPPDAAGLLQISIQRALAAGLTFRPLAETVRDTLEWDASRPERPQPPALLTPEREGAVLRDYAAATSAG